MAMALEKYGTLSLADALAPAIAKNGIKAFYEAEIADLIVRDMEAHGGLISKKYF